MEGSVFVGGVRERGGSVVERILTRLIAGYRRIFTLAKWERGKKVFD